MLVLYHALLLFIRMQFTLKKAPNIFLHSMDSILFPVHWLFVLAYLEDIVIFSESLKARIIPIRQVLTLLCDAGVTVKLKKCKVSSNTINYLSNVIYFGQLAV